MIFNDFEGHLGAIWGHIGGILGHLGAILGPSRGHLGINIHLISKNSDFPCVFNGFGVNLGAIMGPLGAILGHLGATLGPTWGHLGASWGHLGPSWGQDAVQQPTRCFSDARKCVSCVDVAQNWPKKFWRYAGTPVARRWHAGGTPVASAGRPAECAGLLDFVRIRQNLSVLTSDFITPCSPHRGRRI